MTASRDTGAALSVQGGGWLSRCVAESQGEVQPTLMRDYLAKAKKRQQRMRWPMPTAISVVTWFFQWLAPLLFLRRFSRASRLSPDRFANLVHKLHHHRWPLVRATFLLARLSLWDAMADDEAPPERAPHPLQGRLSIPGPKEPIADVLVIGSGAGGAPVAAQLAEQGLSVGIIETGGLIKPESTTETIERFFLQQGMTVAIGNAILPMFAGDTVGGTTSVNSGTTLRPTQEQLEAWDARASSDFATGLLDPYLAAAGEMIGVTTPDWSLLCSSSTVVRDGLAALGRPEPYVLARNAPKCEGAGRCCFGCPADAKLSTDRVHLPRAVDAGARLYAHSRAERIDETPDGVLVEVQGPAGRFLLRGRQLVVAGGALCTPGLLRKNRLGSNWRKAGNGLRTHPATKVFACMPEPIHSIRGVPQAIGYRHPDLPRAVFEGAFTPRAAVPAMLSVTGDKRKWWLDRFDRLAGFGLMLVERSSGKVRDIAGWHRITYKLLPEDALDIGAGIIHLAEIYFAAGAERVLLPAVGIESELHSVDDLKKLTPEMFTPERLMLSGFHPQGSAAMGQVVDSKLRLIGSERISVCDASVLPVSPGVNPMLTIMALSLRLAERLEKELA